MKFFKDSNGQWVAGNPGAHGVSMPDEEVLATKQGLEVSGYGAGPDANYACTVTVPWDVVLEALAMMLTAGQPQRKRQ